MGPDGDFGNPASATHCYGHAASLAVERARSQIADVIALPRMHLFLPRVRQKLSILPF